MIKNFNEVIYVSYHYACHARTLHSKPYDRKLAHR